MMGLSWYTLLHRYNSNHWCQVWGWKLDGLGLSTLTLLDSLGLVDSWILTDKRILDMRQGQVRSSMQAVEEGPRTWVGMGTVLYMEGLLHRFSIPDADWSRILHRIYLQRLKLSSL